jgi:cell pole-organizing protein PopZ
MPPKPAPAPAAHPAVEVTQAAAAEPLEIHPPPVAAAPDPFDDLPDPPPPTPEPAAATPMHITPSHNAIEAMEPDLNAPVAEPPIDPSEVALSHLVAPAAAAAAAESLGSLVRTLAAERATAVHRGGPTIEDLVREEVRPLLKEWLDTHLPPIVERMVRAEIERVVSRMQL